MTKPFTRTGKHSATSRTRYDDAIDVVVDHAAFERRWKALLAFERTRTTHAGTARTRSRRSHARDACGAETRSHAHGGNRSARTRTRARTTTS